ncbi:MAG: serine/threonine protein kinase [Catenulispora sp.]|nr:serine/threonine protein kinase [Catenulispora sp.]
MSIGSTGAGHRRDLLVGGRYRLSHRLGSGGYGRVWLAHDTVLAADVAVKEVLLPPSLSADELGIRLARAEREARNAARLRGHPNVVAVYDVVVEAGVPWTVMQLVRGRSLAEQLVAGGPLSPEQAARVAEGLLRALSAAHQAGLLHRDVKPANVLLADDGMVLLTDFGIAVSAEDPGLTAAGAVVGSAEYLAPERVRGQDAGPPSDLFSLGVTLYEAVEGLSPFRRAETAASFGAVLLDTPPAPSRAPGALGEVIRGLMIKEPERRMTAGAALATLAGAGVPDPVSTASNPPPVSPLQPAAAPTAAPPTVAAYQPPLAGSPAQPNQPGQLPPRRRDPARVLVPLLFAAYFAVVAYLPAFTLPRDKLSFDFPDPTTVRTWQLFRWFPGEAGGLKVATVLQLVGIAAALVALAALTPRRGPALRVVAYLGALFAGGLEIFTDLHYGGPWSTGIPIGPGYWCLWLGMAALAVAVPARDAVSRRRKVA